MRQVKTYIEQRQRPIPGMGKPLVMAQSHRDDPLLSAAHTILSREDWQPGYEQLAQIIAGSCLPPGSFP